MRSYTEDINKKFCSIYDVARWFELVDSGMICNEDGVGYWVKDGMASNDEVFSAQQLDATHVVWHNK